MRGRLLGGRLAASAGVVLLLVLRRFSSLGLKVSDGLRGVLNLICSPKSAWYEANRSLILSVRRLIVFWTVVSLRLSVVRVMNSGCWFLVFLLVVES